MSAEQRIAELEGQVEALHHCLVALVNLIGPDFRDRFVKVNDSIGGRVAVSSYQATEALNVALSRISDDCLEPLVTVGDLD